MQQAPEKTTVPTNLQLDKAVRDELDRQAKENHRSLTGQISWLIEQEARRASEAQGDAA